MLGNKGVNMGAQRPPHSVPFSIKMDYSEKLPPQEAI